MNETDGHTNKEIYGILHNVRRSNWICDMAEKDYPEVSTEDRTTMSQRDIDKYNAIRENSLKEQQWDSAKRSK